MILILKTSQKQIIFDKLMREAKGKYGQITYGIENIYNF